MNNKTLHQVQLTKSSSCLTYALQRIGLELPELTDVAYIDEYFDRLPIDGPETVRSLPVGTLLLCTHKERTDLVPRLITADGRVLWQPVLLLRHVAVTEANGFISDAGTSSKNFPFCKHIRMRNILEIGQDDMPTYYLRLKQESL